MNIGTPVYFACPNGASATLDRINKYFTYSEMPIISSNYRNIKLEGADPYGEDILRMLGKNMAEMLGNCPIKKDRLLLGITVDMIKWWFWWHPQEDKRYQVWYPGEHFSISYEKKDKEYFNAKICPDFQPNTQYPVERIGEMWMPLRIDFVEPESFGFSEELMKENNIPLIICGHVAAYKGLIKHTEMAHLFKQTEDGLFLISRFWIGQTLKNSLLRKLILTDWTAKGMAEHCCVEYRNLAEILPKLYLE